VSAGFLLKKAVSFFLMPLPFGMLLLAVGLFYLYRNRTQTARRFIAGGVIWLFVFSYDPLANAMLYPLEHHYPALLHPNKDIHYIYVLGGGHQSDPTLPITSQVKRESLVRLDEGIRLFHALDGNAVLIVSGAHGIFDPVPHAKMAQKLAMALGIPREKIKLVPTATDTEDEAKAAKAIAEDAPIALVSSAYHLPRAAKWFAKYGVHFTPAPTYHQASLKHPNYLAFFSVEALQKSTIVFHELLGMLWQKIKGV
jgi:uncharacterized SAM-binding protein YcdF (DUF218 family)